MSRRSYIQYSTCVCHFYIFRSHFTSPKGSLSITTKASILSVCHFSKHSRFSIPSVKILWSHSKFWVWLFFCVFYLNPDGIILVPVDKAHGQRLFVEIQLHFRYASLFCGGFILSFKDHWSIFDCLSGSWGGRICQHPFQEMCRLGNTGTVSLGKSKTTSWIQRMAGKSIIHSTLHGVTVADWTIDNWQFVSNWKTALCKKIGDMEGICPFKLEFPQGTPPSLVVAGPAGVGGEPCGLTYQVVAYFCTDPSLPLLKKYVWTLTIFVSVKKRILSWRWLTW